jgi:hypothetical protein
MNANAAMARAKNMAKLVSYVVALVGSTYHYQRSMNDNRYILLRELAEVVS